MSHYAPSVIGFDLVEPLRHVGADALRKRLEDRFASSDGTIGFENHELEIIDGNDVGEAQLTSRRSRWCRRLPRDGTSAKSSFEVEF